MIADLSKAILGRALIDLGAHDDTHVGRRRADMMCHHLEAVRSSLDSPYAEICDAILGAWRDRGIVDIHTISVMLPTTVGISTVSALLDHACEPHAVSDCVVRLRVLVQDRDLRTMITQRIGADNVAVSIREIAASVSPIVQHRAVSIATVASELSAKMQEMETPDYRAITTGISGIDDIVGPMQPGYLVVIGGRTGAGKTALALSLAVHMDRSAIVYSREMPRLQICERVLSIVGQIPLSAYRVLDDYYRWSDRIHQAAMSPVSDRIMVHGATRSTIDDIVSTGCVHPRPEIVVVDYVQLYADAGGENRATEIGRVMHRLKDLALQGYIVIALSQLSRESARPGAERRPGLADLRESGDIEQDADVVLLIDRRENMSKIVVAKNRHGRTGDAEVRWIGESATWV